ncbi:hypothetical protein NL533_35425, partial [Klebsiella pneumoniae]|nr:hypothetical protein [Klebsiella pneumoniae]
ACELLEKIGAGTVTGPMVDVYPSKHHPRTLRLDRVRISGLLGMDVPDASVTRILSSLGFVTTAAPDGWDVTPPPWRVD